jgi:hypothetical protein
MGITHAEIRKQTRQDKAEGRAWVIENAPDQVDAYTALQVFLACMAKLPEREKQGNLRYLEHEARRDLSEIEAWYERQRVNREAAEDEEDRIADAQAAAVAAGPVAGSEA